MEKEILKQKGGFDIYSELTLFERWGFTFDLSYDRRWKSLRFDFLFICVGIVVDIDRA